MVRNPKTEALVEHQALWRQLKEAAGVLDDARTGVAQHEGPYVTVSRQLGTGGTELARLIAAPLGWKVVDREIIAAIAAQGAGSLHSVSQRDEHAAGIFDDYLSHLLVPDDPGQAGYLRAMACALAAFAREGRVVIVGRGANWILDPGAGLRLRVIAGVRFRIARIREHEPALREDDARARLARHDADQRRFVKQTFGREIDDPAGYDLVFNVETLPLAAAAHVAVAAVTQKLAATGAASRR